MPAVGDLMSVGLPSGSGLPRVSPWRHRWAVHERAMGAVMPVSGLAVTANGNRSPSHG